MTELIIDARMHLRNEDFLCVRPGIAAAIATKWRNLADGAEITHDEVIASLVGGQQCECLAMMMRPIPSSVREHLRDRRA